MSPPTRRSVVIAEATQELQAADVLNVLGSLDRAGTGVVGGARRSLGSQSSIAPVGLDLARGTDADEDDEPEGSLTGSVMAPLPQRRRRLEKIVIGAIAACAVILVAAGIARMGHAGSAPPAAAASDPGPTIATGAPTPSGQVYATANAPAATPAASAPDARAAAASAGTVRLGRPSLSGHVWLDGAKIAGTSAVVSCGTHQLKVGRGRKHSIDVPCGGAIAVTR